MTNLLLCFLTSFKIFFSLFLDIIRLMTIPFGIIFWGFFLGGVVFGFLVFCFVFFCLSCLEFSKFPGILVCHLSINLKILVCYLFKYFISLFLFSSSGTSFECVAGHLITCFHSTFFAYNDKKHCPLGQPTVWCLQFLPHLCGFP